MSMMRLASMPIITKGLARRFLRHLRAVQGPSAPVECSMPRATAYYWHVHATARNGRFRPFAADIGRAYRDSSHYSHMRDMRCRA